MDREGELYKSDVDDCADTTESNAHVGSSLDGFLKDEGIYDECIDMAKKNMSVQPAPRDDDDALSIIRKAYDKIIALSIGDEHWTMSIPADRANDPDLVIGDALIAAREKIVDLRAKLSEMIKEREQMKNVIRNWRDFVNGLPGKWNEGGEAWIRRLNAETEDALDEKDTK